jgi:hypothetical protein
MTAQPALNQVGRVHGVDCYRASEAYPAAIRASEAYPDIRECLVDQGVDSDASGSDDDSVCVEPNGLLGAESTPNLLDVQPPSLPG